MTDVKNTPWTVEYEPQWPWHIKIEPDIIRIDRVAYSSKAKTIEDVRNAVGFPFAEREEIQRLIAEQEDRARIIAAAPDLLDAVYKTRQLVSEAAAVGFNYADGDWAERLYANQAVLSDAIAKAKGIKE